MKKFFIILGIIVIGIIIYYSSVDGSPSSSGSITTDITEQENDMNEENHGILVNQPVSNQEINSPLEIKGEAIGYWYFEASFPIELRDSNNNIIAHGLAEAQGDWMTEEFVPFEGILEYDNSMITKEEKGTLVLKRDNPSGLLENDQSYEIPVIFSQ